jgi:hypothetical protein
LAQQIRADEPARNEQGVVLGLGYLIEGAIDAHAAGRLVQVRAADASGPQGNDVHLGASRA